MERLQSMDAVAQRRIFIGTMSGTSADGVDVAIVSISTVCPPAEGALWADVSTELLAHATFPYEVALRARIFAAKQSGNPIGLGELCSLAHDISTSHVSAILSIARSAGVPLQDVVAIGLHGNTLYHAPPLTLQWADPALVAAGTGCTVVADFRRADCAAGGQGAPLVPFADYLLFRPSIGHATTGPEETGQGGKGDGRLAGRILVNLGGIANITVIPSSNLQPNDTSPTSIPVILAFDTGPANCLADHIVRQCGTALSNSGLRQGGMAVELPQCDDDGAWAAVGTVSAPLLDAFISHPYFHASPPKSTDVPHMLAEWGAAGAEEQVMAVRSMEGQAAHQAACDALATACAMTARTLRMGIVRGVAGVACADMDGRGGRQEEGKGGAQGDSGAAAWEVVLSGGGVRNATLVRMIEQELASELSPGVRVCRVCSSERIGMPSEAKEAVAFALLAAATIDRVPGNVPSCTGAAKPVVLGAIYPEP